MRALMSADAVHPVVVDGDGNYHSDDLEVPDNIMLHLYLPHSPELNPQGFRYVTESQAMLQLPTLNDGAGS
jgi:hypothetical protein